MVKNTFSLFNLVTILTRLYSEAPFGKTLKMLERYSLKEYIFLTEIN